MWMFQFGLAISNPTPIEVGDGAVTGFFKLLFVALAFLYFLFAFVVTRQIKVMRTTLITPISPVVRLAGYVHFIFAFIVFVGFVLFL